MIFWTLRRGMSRPAAMALDSKPKAAREREDLDAELDWMEAHFFESI